MAHSGQMVAQKPHPVQREGSWQTAEGTPWLLVSSDMEMIFCGQAVGQSSQPLQRSLSMTTLPLANKYSFTSLADYFIQSVL